MLSINGVNTQCRKPHIAYTGMMNTNQAPKLSQDVIDRLGLNMKCCKGYNGEPDYMPAPDSIGKELAQVFRRMRINWLTHVEK